MPEEQTTVSERTAVEKTTTVPPEKSTDEVKKSSARSEAEKSHGSSSKGSGTAGQSQTASNSRKGGDSNSLAGKSLEYSAGPGAEIYSEGMYVTDAANELDHFNR